jgi:16S rRNA A1518/A1519 N6-dimethyltransferase RsmA/KsgA/DIM1 with predicted DNA glycosylase/AP lyase activity
MDDPDGYFGEPVAASYDDPSDRMFQPEAIAPAVSLLAELAGDGRALELAVGTGRIALPLAQRGVPVHGIELSRAMVARLRAKPGGEAIGVTIGDMATTKVDGIFLRGMPHASSMALNMKTAQERDSAVGRGRIQSAPNI